MSHLNIKKYFKRMKYISARVFVLGLLFMILLSLCILLQGVQTISGEVLPWPLMPMAISCILLIITAFLWVIRPYLQSERIVKRFLNGYYMTDEADINQVVLTPSSQLELQRLDQILHSSQLMDISKRQAQYLALQNQINPHFLYNTLESIRSEALIAGLDSVADMTEALASFFRYTISKVENLVSVEEELQNCETYFRIQQYRFGDRLQMHIDYDREEWEEIIHCRIPKLTLQPILENSIIHGTELKIGTGNLKIQFERTEKRLIIRISDDGVGMDEETLTKLNQRLGRGGNQLTGNAEETAGGIALINVNNRIHLIFGEEYGMHVYSIPGKGTDVEISIPMITSDREIKRQGVLS